MADRGEQQFTEAEKRQIEMWNRQFVQKKYLAHIRRRNMMVFGGLLTSVAAICILLQANTKNIASPHFISNFLFYLLTYNSDFWQQESMIIDIAKVIFIIVCEPRKSSERPKFKHRLSCSHYHSCADISSFYTSHVMTIR